MVNPNSTIPPTPSCDTKLPCTWIGCDRSNYGFPRGHYKVLGIVIHVMAGSLLGTDAWFKTSVTERGKVGDAMASSAHYGIGRSGTLHQYVPELTISYHAGRSSNPTPDARLLIQAGGGNINNVTIGIEHEGLASDIWPDTQYAASAALIFDLCTRHQIPITREYILGHHEVFSLKPCPGKCDLDHLVKLAAALETSASTNPPAKSQT